MDARPTEPQKRVTSRFIPLTRQAVISDLCTDPAASGERERFAHLALRLQRYRNRAYRSLAEEMRRCYLPFSPDRDTIRVLTFTNEERSAMETRLSELTRHLLDRANYQPIGTEKLNEILNEDGPYSLKIEVDLSEYDELLLCARETYTTTESVRTPETFFLKRTYDVRVYRRLFLFLKLKSQDDRAVELAEEKDCSLDKAKRIVKRRRKQLPKQTSSDFIYMKVFKDIPEHDLQILFPLRTVQFRPFDKIKFFATAGGGTLFGVFTTTGKVLAATNPFALLGAFAGFVGLLARQITTFFNQRNRYMMELAQKLFFHNLANNRAALALLLDRAEEEDVKEDLITLYFNQGETVPVAELQTRKERIDSIILDRYGAAVDFELPDALARLKKDGVVTEQGDSVVFASLAEAGEIYGALLAGDDTRAAGRICDPAPVDAVLEG